MNVQYAETHLADLISAASRGETVQIEGPEHTAHILTFPTPKPSSGLRTLCAARGQFASPPLEDWDDKTVWTEPAIPRSEIFGCAKGMMKLSDYWDSPEKNAEITALFEGDEPTEIIGK